MDPETTSAAPETSTQTTTTSSSSSSGGGASGSGRATQLKRQLRGMDFDAQQAALEPGAAVQAAGGAVAGDDVQRVAAEGVSGGGGALPHGDRIQAAFGRHDVGSVQAHVGGGAAKATSQLGAEAYATGNNIAFGGAPSLHTAAHEAAHVVQQRAGVSLSGGVGKAGDAYEQHADKVADAVVQGKSAEGLLDGMTGGGGGGGNAIQKKDDDNPPHQDTPANNPGSQRTTEQAPAAAENAEDAREEASSGPSAEELREYERTAREAVRKFTEKEHKLILEIPAGFADTAKHLLEEAEKAIGRVPAANRGSLEGDVKRAKDGMIDRATGKLESAIRSLDDAWLNGLKTAAELREYHALLGKLGGQSPLTAAHLTLIGRLDEAKAAQEALRQMPYKSPVTVAAMEEIETGFTAVYRVLGGAVTGGVDWAKLVEPFSRKRADLLNQMVSYFPWDYRGENDIPLERFDEVQTTLRAGKAAFDRLAFGMDAAPAEKPEFEEWTNWQSGTLLALIQQKPKFEAWLEALKTVDPEADAHDAEKVDAAFVADIGMKADASQPLTETMRASKVDFDVDLYKPQRRNDQVMKVHEANNKFAELEGTPLDTLSSEHAVSVEADTKAKEEALQQVYGLAVPKWEKVRAEMRALKAWSAKRKGKALTAEEQQFLRLKTWEIYSTGVSMISPAALYQELVTTISTETIEVDETKKGGGLGEAGNAAGTATALTNTVEALDGVDSLAEVPMVGSAMGLQVFGRYVQRKGQGWDTASAMDSAMGEALVRGVAYLLFPASLKIAFGITSLGGLASKKLAERSQGKDAEGDVSSLAGRLQPLTQLVPTYRRNKFKTLIALDTAIKDYTKRIESLQLAQK